MDTFNFFKADGKFIFNITGGVSIMRQLYVVMEPIFFLWNTKTQMPFHSFLFPEVVPFLLCAGPDEELHLHLLEFPHPENELAGNNLISECLTDLCNTKG